METESVQQDSSSCRCSNPCRATEYPFTVSNLQLNYLIVDELSEVDDQQEHSHDGEE